MRESVREMPGPSACHPPSRLLMPSERGSSCRFAPVACLNLRAKERSPPILWVKACAGYGVFGYQNLRLRSVHAV